MPKLFSRNIDNRGRLIRAIIGVVLVVGAIVGWFYSIWITLVLGASAGFTFFEAARGWCGLRACGIKTKF